MTEPIQIDTNDNGTDRDRDRPRNELDLYDSAVRSRTDDDLLSGANFGLGNYRDKEMWQQVESFRHAMFAEAAFSRQLEQRATRKAKREAARQYWHRLDPEERAEYDVDTADAFAREGADAVWDDRDALRLALDEPRDDLRREKLQALALAEFADWEGWQPPMQRMMGMRHEASRSRGSRLLDNIFGRVEEYLGDMSGKAASKLGGDR